MCTISSSTRRLAIDRSEQGTHLGGHLLVDALRRAVRGGRDYGARAVVVDAIDERAARFYRHLGFHDLDQHRLGRRLGDLLPPSTSDAAAADAAR